MGSTFSPGLTKAQRAAELTKTFSYEGTTYESIATQWAGTSLWEIRKESFDAGGYRYTLGVCQITRTTYHGQRGIADKCFGITEGPYDYSCPAKLMDQFVALRLAGIEMPMNARKCLNSILVALGCHKSGKQVRGCFTQREMDWLQDYARTQSKIESVKFMKPGRVLTYKDGLHGTDPQTGKIVHVGKTCDVTFIEPHKRGNDIIVLFPSRKRYRLALNQWEFK